MTVELVESARPVATTRLDHLACTTEDLVAVSTAVEWARHFLGSPHPHLGRNGPVCPYIRHSFDERLLYVTCRTEERCDDDALRAALLGAKEWFLELQKQAPAAKAHLVTVLVVLPRIDRSCAGPLDGLHAELKDEFVASGTMIGQFHPTCSAGGLWDPDFRPLQSPIPLLAIRDMVSSDLPFLVSDPIHASTYFERFAADIPPHTRRFLVERVVRAPSVDLR
jgi:hypothetical protein